MSRAGEGPMQCSGKRAGVTCMSTNVLESAKGLANSMALMISPWQYNGESQGAVTEPLV